MCKKWNEEVVVQTRKSSKYEVKFGAEAHRENDIPKFLAEMRNTLHFPFGCVLFGSYLPKTSSTQILELLESYGSYIKSVVFVLHIGNFMTQLNFASILSKLSNLELLQVFGFPSSIGSLKVLLPELENSPPMLKKLTRFKLSHPGQDAFTKSVLESEYSTEFLQFLFKNAPNLASTAVFWPTESKSRTISNYITALSQAYKGTKGLLDLQLNCTVNEDQMRTLIDCNLTLENLTITFMDQNVVRGTIEDLLKSQRLSLKLLDIGDGGYDSPEQFVWARTESMPITFPVMKQLKTLILKCDGSHEFRKLGFTQICFSTQFPALTTLKFLESPGSIDYFQMFLLPLPLPLSISQKSYTIKRLQISAALRLVRIGFLSQKNFVKLLSKRFPVLTSLNIYYVTPDLLPHVWKYFKKIEQLKLVFSGSNNGPTFLDSGLTGVDGGICKWFSKNIPGSASDGGPLIQSIFQNKKRSICDLKSN